MLYYRRCATSWYAALAAAGQTRYTSGSTATNYLFTGQPSESSSMDGVYFFKARFYDSSIGRFLSADSIIPPNQGVQGYDRYAFVSNNPVNRVDPDGHDDEWWNPFFYDVVSFDVMVDTKEVLGIDVTISFKGNMKALREGDLKNFDFSVNAETAASIGVSADISATVGVTGSDGSVQDQSNLFTLGNDGVPINGGVCYTLCVGGNVIGNPNADNKVSSSVTWKFGIGEGFDASADIIKGSDWFMYVKTGESYQEQVPFFNPVWGKKAGDKVRDLTPKNLIMPKEQKE